MKKLLLCVLVFISIYSYGQIDGLLINENFPYTSGSLTGKGSSPAWASSAGGTDVIVTALTNNTGALTYPGYSSGTSYVTTNNNSTRSPYKGFIGSQAPSATAATTFYMSFVVNVAGNGDTKITSNALPTVALRTSGGTNFANFYVADNSNGAGGQLKFGISKTESGTGNGSYASGTYTYGQTYLIVIRYDIATGSTTDDKMYMWVNPATNTEPSTASADVSITSGSEGTISGTVTALQIKQDDSNGSNAKLDAFKVSYATGYTVSPSNPIVAWADLSAEGAPLPVKFGSIKASRQTNSVMVGWTSYTESNLNHYEIERSTDGRMFTTIGQIKAMGNSSNRIDYNWIDNFPLSTTAYYRVLSVDIDGKITYSTVVKVNAAEAGKAGISIYPNPVIGSQVAVQFKNLKQGEYTIQLFNSTGQVVNKSGLYITGEMMTQTIQLPSTVKPGIYSLQVTGVDTKLSQSVIVSK